MLALQGNVVPSRFYLQSYWNPTASEEHLKMIDGLCDIIQALNNIQQFNRLSTRNF
jgi:hypothetical protein